MGAGAGVLGQFTPENRMALYQQLLQKQNGMGNAVGTGLSSLADALGAVAGGGRPTTNYGEKNQAINQNARGEGEALMEQGAKEKGAQYQLGVSAEDRDPNSASSKAAQQIATKVTGQNMAGMPAAILNPILSTSATMADARARIIETYSQLHQQYSIAIASLQETKAARQQGAITDQEKQGLWQSTVNKFLHPEAVAAEKGIAETGMPSTSGSGDNQATSTGGYKYSY
jgi:hypothetical protein